jgi:hypothetical protein
LSSIMTWDTLDIVYLANTFSIPQLEHEIATTKRKFPFEDWHSDYVESCKEAIRWIKNHNRAKYTPSSKFVDVESFKNTVDIVDIVERYTHIRKAGHNFKGLCPFHSEKQPSFTVYPDKQSWHCFGACSTGGDVIALVMKAENTDFKGAVAILGGGR